MTKKKRARRPRYSRRITSRKTKVYFWWEIYRTLLKFPRLVERLGLDRALERSAKFYEAWGDVTTTDYETWWKAHRQLFLDESPKVVVLQRSHFKRQPHGLYLELNLNQKRSVLIHLVRYHLQKATQNRSLVTGKRRNIHTLIHFTEGAEIRVTAYRDFLNVLQTLVAPYPEATVGELWEIAKRRYGVGNQVKKTTPERFREHLASETMTQSVKLFDSGCYLPVWQYRKKVQALCKAVANGKFPGSA